ncbi:polysaccharide deacetylase family protein [Kitasatospora sp. NPDC004240]
MKRLPALAPALVLTLALACAALATPTPAAPTGTTPAAQALPRATPAWYAPARYAPTRPVPAPTALLPDHLLGTEVRRIPTDDRVMALTFNAAWDETGLTEVLAELRRRQAPATFFPTGRFAEAHPGAVRAMAAEHGVGNHSHSHPELADLGPGELEEEVLRADTAIRTTAGTDPLPFFRFPYGETTPEAIDRVNELGFADVEFTTDTNGYLGQSGGMTVQRAVDRALAALVPGEILQLHIGVPDGNGPALDAQALPLIIDAVRARGYRIVDLRTMLTG